ncbi:MAG: hypothetical protein LKI39_13145 [Bacteroides sp.]|jgi:hypothetical protein|nr:hypothetical protein [Bacteroides sp.]MCI1683482.1 hypothetical protein [Bacteroides sp.]
MNGKEYFKELSIVILGILIAFWINNIGAGQKEKATQKQVLNTILSELKENKENIKESIANLDSLQSAFVQIQETKNNIKHSANITIKYTGSDLKNVGYEIAKYTGILKDLDPGLMSKIVECYKYQDSLNELESSMRNGIFGFFKDKGEDNINYLVLQISILTENFKRLETEQDILIEDLTKYLAS